MAHKDVESKVPPLSFEQFWSWLQLHPGCILRVGTLDSVIWDHDDHHWTFGSDANGSMLLQCVRGKRPIADIFIDPSEVAYVAVEPSEDGEHFFDLHDEQQKVLYYFVMAHEYDVDEVDTHQWN